MSDVLILRQRHTDQGVFGRLITPGFECYTLERPWLDNKSSISCIPVGTYKCFWTWSPRFKRRVYLVAGVTGRDGIRIHPANIYTQLNGCIALGEKLGVMEGLPAVLVSAPAVRNFEMLMAGQTFTLEIKDA